MALFSAAAFVTGKAINAAANAEQTTSPKRLSNLEIFMRPLTGYGEIKARNDYDAVGCFSLTYVKADLPSSH